MPRTFCLALALLVLAGCSPTPKPLPVAAEKKAKDSAPEADKPEVRFVVSAKPTRLEVLNGQQVESTVVLYWKIRVQGEREQTFAARRSFRKLFFISPCHDYCHAPYYPCRRKVTGPVIVMGDAVAGLLFLFSSLFPLLPSPPELWYIVL